MFEFAGNYFVARDRFGQAAATRGWRQEAHAIAARGPAGEELTIDIAISPDEGERVEHRSALVVSSGLHGVEGLFGSTVQRVLLEHDWKQVAEFRGLRVVLIHALNPFGFAWLRRANEDNVDPNRNFLLAGETFSGSPPGYAALDGLLNPRRPPRRLDGFYLQAAAAMVRQGMPALKQAIAGGQYDFPQGLFYGGQRPTQTQDIVRQHLPRWLGDCQQVVHIDLHTGLGASLTDKLLVDYELTPAQRKGLTRWFGPSALESATSQGVAYQTRGSFGRWLVEQHPQRDYLYLCDEFGTYSPLRMLAGLRAENQAFHWGRRADESNSASRKTKRFSNPLPELFCPASPTWRGSVLALAISRIRQAARGLKDWAAEGSP